MNYIPIEKIYSSFEKLVFEKQFLFIFDKHNNFIKKIPLSSTKEEKSGLTLFENLSVLSDYDDSFKFFIVHNHPSNTSEPSHADYENMLLISYFFEFFSLNITDYLIVSEFGFFSFSKHKILPFHLFNRYEKNKSKGNTELIADYDFDIDSISFFIKNCLSNYENCFFVFSKQKLYIYFDLTFDDLLFLFSLYEPFVFFDKNSNFNISYLLKLLKPIHFFSNFL